MKHFDQELEELVLSSCLRDTKAYAKIKLILPDKAAFQGMSFGISHSRLFDAIIKTFERCEVITPETVCLNDKELDRSLVTQISGLHCRSAYVDDFAERMQDLWIQRQRALICDQGTKVFEDSGKDSVVKTVEKLTDLISVSSGTKLYDVSGEALNLVNTLEDDAKDNTKQKRYYVGNSTLDAWTGGLRPGTLTMILGAPGMGKSDCAMSWILEISKHDPVLFLSAEMPKEDVAIRMIAMHTGINSNTIRDGQASKLFDANWSTYGLGKKKIYVDDSATPSAMDVRAKVATFRAKYGARCVVFIDHLQKMKHYTKYASVNDNVRATTVAIEAIAKDYNIPIVLLNQINREGQNQDRPLLQHGRQGGDEDAHLMVFLWRDGYQKTDLDEDVVEWLVRKNRGGKIGTVYCRYVLTTGKQTQLEHQPVQKKEEDAKPKSAKIVKTEEAPF